MSKDQAGRFIADVAFTPSVKRAQAARGSRANYQRRVETSDWPNRINDDLRAFIADRDSFYLATASADGQPYVQHRGGPRGFLKVLDDKTLGFADFAGNRQYISVGNAAENDKAYIFLMDYFNRRRLKLWGRLAVVEKNAELLKALAPRDYGGRPERVFLFKVAAWDVNCPQHIPQKVDRELVERSVDRLSARIAELEAEVERLRRQAGTT